MSNVPDLVDLLYRADWTRLSLVAEVEVRRESNSFTSRVEDAGFRAEVPHGLRFGPMRPVLGNAPWDAKPSSQRLWDEKPWSQRLWDQRRATRSTLPFGADPKPWWTGREWEVVADSLRVETSRSTLLIASGGRYRQQGGDSIEGCNGERHWLAVEKDGGWVVEVAGRTHPPLAKLLQPSWLLNGYILEAGEAMTAGGRDGLRVVATPRAGVGHRDLAGVRPLDGVEVIVDTELGILLRLEEIADGQPLSVTELENVSLDQASAADDTQFLPPGGWDTVRPEPPGAPGGPVWEAAKLATGLAAKGISVLIRRSSGDPFGQATQEEPEAEMPADEPDPGDGSPVSDEVLQLLYRSEELWAPGITATLHQWHDMATVLARVPERFRQAGFGGIGSFLDVTAAQVSTVHTVSRLRIAGPLRYRIDTDPQPSNRTAYQARTIVCDGERRWETYDEVVNTGAAEPPPAEVADLLNSAWLLEQRLSGGSQAVVSGRRGYHLNVISRDRPWDGMFSPDEVVVDAEFGIVLRWTSFLGSRPVVRCELRDVAAYLDEPGDFVPDLPPGRPVVDKTEQA